MNSILIVYTTVGGNTAMVVEKVSQVLAENDFSPELKRVELVEFSEIKNYDLVILASPTYGQGTVEAHFVPFLKEMKKEGLSGQNCVVIGLGDVKYYPHYLTEATAILENYVKESGGNLFVPSMRIGKNPISVLDSMVNSWTQRLVKKIKEA